jgi:hypothetical protein
MAADRKSEQIILRSLSKAAEGCCIPRRWRAGEARHSVRAAVENLNASVGRRRRAGDCAPYRRFLVTARHSGMANVR